MLLLLLVDVFGLVVTSICSPTEIRVNGRPTGYEERAEFRLDARAVSMTCRSSFSSTSVMRLLITDLSSISPPSGESRSTWGECERERGEACADRWGDVEVISFE